MAKRAHREANKEIGRPWRRREVRASILEAARRLVARDDGVELTLGRVADEADFAPSTVYAYFVNKNELIIAIVADDLATLAREMRDVFPANEDARNGDGDEDVDETAADEAPSEVAAEPVVETDAAVSDFSEVHDAETPLETFAEQCIEYVEPADTSPEPAAPEQETEHRDLAESDAVAPAETVNEPVEAVEVETADEHPADDAAPVSADEDVADEHVEETSEAVPVQSVEPADLQEVTNDPVEETPEALAASPSELRPPSMPVVEKKWALQIEPERDSGGAIARLEASIAKLEARPVDAWLERRLRELERMISSLEERQGNTERNSGTASGVAEETVRALQERVDTAEKNQRVALDANAKASGERLDASEKRLRQMIADLRALTMEASSRIDVLERGNAPFGHHQFVESIPDAVEEPAVEPETTDPVVPPDADTPTAPVAGVSYLSQARRSAMAAAAQTVAQPTGREPLQRLASTVSSIKAGSRSTRYVIAGGVALLVVLLSAGIALKNRAAIGNESSPSPFQTAAAAHATKSRTAQQFMAPQIRLASLAGRGNADAQLLLGLEYLDGTGAAKNETEAAQWIAKSAAHGNAIAQFWLGTIYANGRGVKADTSLAMHWYEEAAMQGNRKAMHQLAVSYAEGWGATKNYAEAARWFSRAASLGYVDSAFNLGVLYERGLGMPQSLLDAYKWYSIASALGDKGSIGRIAVLKTQMNASDMAAATQAATSFTADPMDQTANTTPTLAQLPRA